eukprot:NODE_1404_length_883_cov_150.111511_g1159_i0.p5 GENE.NODE_1404_length_883_cov_150.111511_g1159_i0~~NODE_1404_length_883_cov_150.111511_g1159_i0.p5  ORF type:complete len:55 (-),score=8.76 NODE_1404_length_883_cov_150.111511_g1159_i0:564-728(-)
MGHTNVVDKLSGRASDLIAHLADKMHPYAVPNEGIHRPKVTTAHPALPVIKMFL